MPIPVHKITIKTTIFLLITSTLASCTMPISADKFFGIAVLNTNLINTFATPQAAKRIQDQTIEFEDMPSSKKKGDEARKNVETTVLTLEQALEKVKELPDSESTQEIKNEAVALYEYVLPVYKNEYMAYAKLCDAKGPQDQKDAIIQTINDKYAASFERMYSSFLVKGKAFADANNLNVNWD
jgi:hypothetical protein